MFQKIFTTSITQLIERLLMLLSMVLITQFLGDEGKGHQTLIIVTIGFIIMACEIIGGASLIYLASRYSITKLITSSYLWTIIVCFFAYFIVDFFAPVAGEFVFHISILSIIYSFTKINMNIILGKENINVFNILKIVIAFFQVAGLAYLFFIMKEENVMAYIKTLYLSYSATFIISFLFVRKYFDTFSFNNFNDVINATFRYGFLNQISHAMHEVSHAIGFFVLAMYYGEGSVGVFSIALTIAEAMWLISKSIATVQYARIANSNDIKSSQLLTVNLTKFAVAATVVGIVLLVLIPSVAYEWVFGDEFGGARHITLFLIPGIALHNVSLLIGHYFAGTGKFIINVYSNGAGLVSSAIFMYLLIPIYGMVGAATATSISFLVFSTVALIFFKKDTNIGPLRFLPRLKDFYLIKEEFNKFRASARS